MNDLTFRLLDPAGKELGIATMALPGLAEAETRAGLHLKASRGFDSVEVYEANAFLFAVSREGVSMFARGEAAQRDCGLRTRPRR